MRILDIFKRRKAASSTPEVEHGLDDVHVQLRRAIEHCDAYRIARDAGQKVTIQELVTRLHRNNFSRAVIKQAVEESWGEEVTEQMLG
ncbi:MAG: hypothetical protein Q7S96_04490 [bacterium]|nr:hypothetical protein [bacterium]